MIARSAKEPMRECSLNRPVSDARMTVIYVRSYTPLIVVDAYTFTPHGGTVFNHVFFIQTPFALDNATFG